MLTSPQTFSLLEGGVCEQVPPSIDFPESTSRRQNLDWYWDSTAAKPSPVLDDAEQKQFKKTATRTERPSLTLFLGIGKTWKIGEIPPAKLYWLQWHFYIKVRPIDRWMNQTASQLYKQVFVVWLKTCTSLTASFKTNNSIHPIQS